MDTEITLRINEDILHAAVGIADRKGLSIQQFAEFLFEKATSDEHLNLNDFPVADWVLQLGEGPVEYNPKTRKELKEEFFESKK